MVDIVFRGAGPWGAGSAGDLTEVEFDTNNWNLKNAVETALANNTVPNNIANIEKVDNENILITMDDDTTFGPFPLPIAEFHDRGEYSDAEDYVYADIFTATTSLVMVLQEHTTSGAFNPAATNGFGPLYRVLFDASGMTMTFLDDGYPAEGEDLSTFEVFSVDDVGVFLVLQDHEATDPFDPDLEIGGNPAYKKIFGPIETAVARIQFQLAGTIPADGSLVWKLIQDDPRDLVLPADFAGSIAHLETEVSADISFEFNYGGDVVGTLTFAVGELLDGDGGQFGTFIGDGATISVGQLLRMYAPSDNGDATYLTVALVGTYVDP